ncbi:TPM domain-containing protein [Microbacterium sp. NPDC056234]|uniref:TPM domain-containing protein n=1 Tax=Microbacterium sp. NPDC056234 TaxID=3345757 RepID=UPI0035D79C03
MTKRIRPTRARGLVALLSVLMIGSGVAYAETPPELDQGYVTDLSGVLSDSDEARLEQRLGELAAADDRPELFVALVPDFEDPTNALTWADETALRNNLASDQYLLAIATDGRSLAISAEYGDGGAAAGPLSESRVLDIEDQLGAGYLADEDWAGGIEYVADEFEKVPWPWWVWVLGVAGLALIIFLITRLVLFLRRRAASAAELRTLEGQKKRAARLLVQTDEAVRTSEQELGFVTAEFGEETTAEFAAVLDGCRSRLQEAFQLLEKLQDADEDTPHDTRSWTDTIIRLCRQVDDDLNGRKRQLASLRALADGAADTLARLRSERQTASAFPGAAADRLATLATAFSAAELVGVADNPDEIEGRLRAADVQIEALQKAVDARRPKAISDAVHEIERLLAEAKDLRDAVDAEADALAARTAEPAEEAAEAPEQMTGSVLDRAKAAVRAAELSVQARPGEVSSFPLTRLYFAQRQLAEAVAATGAEDIELRAASALAAAEQVQSLVGTPVAPESRRFVRSAPSAEDTAIMYDAPASGSSTRSEWRRSYAYENDEGTGGKAVWGGVGGGIVGFVSSLSVAGDEPGLIVMFVIGGVVLGALSGAFGGNGGGSSSSSGWGGSSRSSSSRSSWGGSSRSSGSRSSGGTRSSGRSGGRRF